MKNFQLILIISALNFNVWATNKNSETVFDHTEITIHSVDEVIYERNYTVTILNKFEEDLNKVIVYYDKGNIIKELKAEVIPLQGKTKKYKKKDFEDWSADFSSVASDDRVLYLSVNQNNYPYTLKVSYLIEYKGSMFFPRWIPQRNRHHHVKEASLKINNLDGINLRFEHFNMNPPKKDSNGYTAFVNFVEPFEFEYYNQNGLDYFPTLYIIAENFSLYGNNGSFKSWQSYGEFQELLNQNSNNLSEQQIAELKKVASGQATVLEKIKAVYDYLQDNSRYVSVQLGVGGWQPQKAAFTHEKKYGDCKALSYYTQSILKVLDIDAYYTIIKAGKHDYHSISEKPNPYFNHVILTVPVKKDTIWLECTSQTNPCGYLSTFTSDRPALLVNGKNSELIYTKKYTEEENTLFTNSQINITDTEGIQVHINRTLSGIQLSESGLMHYNRLTAIEKKNQIDDLKTIKNFNINHFEVTDPTNEIVPKAQVNIKGEISNWFKSKSSRLFINLEEYFSEAELEFSKTEREKPVYIQYPFTKIDTIHIQHPANYVVEAGLKEINLDTPFGSYHVQQLENDTNQLSVIRKLVLLKGKYMPKEYKALKAFADEIEKNDQKKLVFKIE